MAMTETTRAPSLFKPALLFAAAAALVALSSRAPAQNPSSPRAYASEPKVRIRGVSAEGLDPIAFADWIAAHRDVHALRRAAPCVQADARHDGFVPPVESKKDLLVVHGMDHA